VKVLFIVTAYPRSADDLITPWLVETIRHLGGRGIEVEVLAPSYRGLGDQVVQGVRVHRFRYAPRAWETLTHEQTAPDRIRERPHFLALVPSYVAAGARAAARLARTGEFDLVHAFWPIPHGLLGLAARRAGGIPLVSTFFGVELTWMESQLPFVRPLLRGIVRGSDAVTVISSYTGEQLRRSVPDAHAVVIPFGATVEAPAEVGEPFSSSGPMRLLFVGRLVERKGVHRLLEAIALLPRTDAVLLRVLGDGPERPRLERLAAELGVERRVEFAGFVPADALQSAFEEADALVLPAVYDRKGDVEGLGVVLIEAMAHSRPVIGSDAGGIPDIIRDGETGLLVPPDDPLALSQAIERLRSDPQAARELGARGRDWVARQFGWERIADTLEGLYRSLLAGR
jgi:glycosyltransferase involved in cell wall biosynthesis